MGTRTYGPQSPSPRRGSKCPRGHPAKFQFVDIFGRGKQSVKGIVILTGGTSGIGLETVKQLEAAGVRVTELPARAESKKAYYAALRQALMRGRK